MIKTWEPQAKSCLCKLPKVSVFQVIRQCGTITFTSGAIVKMQLGIHCNSTWHI